MLMLSGSVGDEHRVRLQRRHLCAGDLRVRGEGVEAQLAIRLGRHDKRRVGRVGLGKGDAGGASPRRRSELRRGAVQGEVEVGAILSWSGPAFASGCGADDAKLDVPRSVTGTGRSRSA